MAVTPLVVVLLSFAHINLGPSVVFDRKCFGNFIFILKKRNVDDETLGKLIGDSLFKSKDEIFSKTSQSYLKFIFKLFLIYSFFLQY
jgi:hypothetical protein